MNPPPSFDLEAVLAQRDFIRSIARGLLGDDEQAEDVVQDTCLLALERPPSRRDALRAWMARVARNLALNARRREGERPERERRAARPERVQADEDRDLGLEQEVVEAVRSLPQPHRTTIYLRFYKGLGPTAIAEELGVPVSTVKTRLARGLELVREDLDRRHGGRQTWSHALLAFALPELAGTPLGAPLGSAGTGAALGSTAWKGLLLMNKPLAVGAAMVLAAVSVVLWTDPFGGAAERQNELPQERVLAQPEVLTPEAELEAADIAAASEAVAVKREVVTPQPVSTPKVQPGATVGLMGRVVDAAGRPVAGAEVEIAARGLGGLGMRIAVSGADHESHLDTGDADSTLTDSDGRFVLPVAEDGMLNLVVGAEGFAPFRKELTAYYGRRTDAGQLELTPEVVLAGRVVDEGGQPVKGARIRSAERFGPANVLSVGAGPAVVATTDADGRFTVRRQAAGPWALTVTSEHHKQGELKGRTEAGGERVEGLEIVLEEGLKIAGRLSGRPASAGELWVRATPEESGGGSGTMRVMRFGGGSGMSFGAQAAARVQRDGTFVVGGLEAGRYTLTVYDREQLFGGNAKSDTVKARAGDDGVELSWSLGAALSFQVVDGRTGDPIERFSVTTGGDGHMGLGGDHRPTQDYPDGIVLLEGLRVRGDRPKTTLGIQAEGYAPLVRSGIALPAGGSTLDLGVLRLEPVPMAYVTVVDSQGNPVEGANVELATAVEGGLPGQVERRISISLGDDGAPETGVTAGRGRTDASGLAAFPSQPGTNVSVKVNSPRHAAFESEPVLVPSDQDFEFPVVLLEGAAVEVLVHDLDGTPLPGARVEHREIHDLPEGMPDLGALLHGANRQRTTDSEGKAWFRNLGVGKHAFRIASESAPSGWFGGGSGGSFVTFTSGQEDVGNPWTEIEVFDGDERQVILSKEEKSLLSGRVSENGVSLVGATLTLNSAEDDSHGFGGFGGGPNTKSDGEGAYTFEELNPGSYELEIKHPDRAMPSVYEVEVNGGSTYFDVDLDLAMVEGRITDREGRGIPGVAVTPVKAGEGRRPVMIMMTRSVDGDDEETSVTTALGGIEPVRTDAEGYYVLRGVPSGVLLKVEAESDEWSSASSEAFDLTPNEVLQNVNLTLEKGGSLRVTVWDEDGKPAGNQLILLRRLEDGEAVGAPEVSMTSPEGVASFKELKTGPWQVELRSIGPDATEGPEAQEVEIQEGVEATVQFDM